MSREESIMELQKGRPADTILLFVFFWFFFAIIVVLQFSYFCQYIMNFPEKKDHHFRDDLLRLYLQNCIQSILFLSKTFTLNLLVKPSTY